MLSKRDCPMLRSVSVLLNWRSPKSFTAIAYGRDCWYHSVSRCQSLPCGDNTHDNSLIFPDGGSTMAEHGDLTDREVPLAPSVSDRGSFTDESSTSGLSEALAAINTFTDVDVLPSTSRDLR